MPALKERLEGFAASQDSRLPLPGGGCTPRRHRALHDWGRTDLSFARIAEAHVDALAILAEGGYEPRPRALYGVWASDAPPSRVRCEKTGDGTWRIHGIKQFCSGAGFVDAALVTAQHAQGPILFDLAIQEPEVSVQPSQWRSPAFADTSTTAVSFDCFGVPERFRVGPPGWYLDRPGFWHGSLGPAACWAGGAQSLIDAAVAAKRRDPHSRAHVGALLASEWEFNAILNQAGQEIDADPQDELGCARARGLKVRHLIERICAETLDRFARATGPHLLAYDEQVIRQHAALTLYIRQCHGERDLESIPAREPERTPPPT